MKTPEIKIDNSRDFPKGYKFPILLSLNYEAHAESKSTNVILKKLGNLGVGRLDQLVQDAVHFSNTFGSVSRNDYLGVAAGLKSDFRGAMSDQALRDVTGEASAASAATGARPEAMGNFFSKANKVFRKDGEPHGEFSEKLGALVAFSKHNLHVPFLKTHNALKSLDETAGKAKGSVEEFVVAVGMLKGRMGHVETAKGFSNYYKNLEKAKGVLGVSLSGKDGAPLPLAEGLEKLRNLRDSFEGDEGRFWQKIKEAFGGDEAANFIKGLIDQTSSLRENLGNARNAMGDGKLVSRAKAYQFDSVSPEKNQQSNEKYRIDNEKITYGGLTKILDHAADLLSNISFVNSGLGAANYPHLNFPFMLDAGVSAYSELSAWKKANQDGVVTQDEKMELFNNRLMTISGLLLGAAAIAGPAAFPVAVAGGILAAVLSAALIFGSKKEEVVEPLGGFPFSEWEGSSNKSPFKLRERPMEPLGGFPSSEWEGSSNPEEENTTLSSAISSKIRDVYNYLNPTLPQNVMKDYGAATVDPKSQVDLKITFKNLPNKTEIEKVESNGAHGYAEVFCGTAC